MREKKVVAIAVATVVLLGAAWHAIAQDAKAPYPSTAPLDQYLMEDRASEIGLARSAAPESISLILLPGAGGQAVAQAAKAAYPAMAPLDQYLISDEQSEIALARSAAPSSISDGAEVMVLGREGYKTAVKGTNGFLCIVERSWAQGTDNAEFWNPKMRAPHCFNAQAARSFAPIYLMKTRLVLAGKSQAEIAQAIATALDKNELPALEPGAMAYMMSQQQYLNEQIGSTRLNSSHEFVSRMPSSA